MPVPASGNFLRRIRRNGDNAEPSLVKLGTQFFPSPQLGDTVGSPVTAKELEQQGLPCQRRGLKTRARVIQGAELGYFGAGHDRAFGHFLTADSHGEEQEGAGGQSEQCSDARSPAR